MRNFGQADITGYKGGYKQVKLHEQSLSATENFSKQSLRGSWGPWP